MQQKFNNLDELIAIIDAAENPELLLLEIIIDNAQQKNPDLSESLRYCAIPRRFNENLIGVLEPNHQAKASSLLKELLDYEFVTEVENGWYAYHDNTRDLLLDDWRSEENETTFKKYNNRLIEYYQRKRNAFDEIETNWKIAANIIHRANEQRYYQLVTQIEKELKVNIIEILYHTILQSASDGFNYFQKLLFRKEEENPNLCLSLLNVTRLFLKLASPKTSEPEQLNKNNLWLDYFEARLHLKLSWNNIRGLEEAKDLFEKLESNKDVKKYPKLYAWTLSSLGSILIGLHNYNEANQKLYDSFSLRKEITEDRFNEPLDYAQFANIHWHQRKFEKAFYYFGESVKIAREQGNIRLEISSWKDQCLLLQAQGKEFDSFLQTLELLHTVWTQFSEEKSLHKIVIETFFQVYFNRSPQLLDCAFRALNSLFDIEDDLIGKSYLHLTYIELLFNSGRYLMVEKELDRIIKTYNLKEYSYLEKELLYRKGFLHQSQGELKKAVQKFIELKDHKQATKWDIGAALHNLGEYYLQQGEFDQAQNFIFNSIKHWDKMGLKKFEDLSRINYAELLFMQGDIKGAQKVLNKCQKSLLVEYDSYQVDYYKAQGKLYEVQGEWSRAQELYKSSLEICLKMVSLTREAARTFMDLSRVAERQAKWKFVVENTAKANRLHRKLREINHYHPTRITKLADKLFVEGLQILFSGSNEKWNDKLNSAQEKFKEASNLKNDNILINLYWMYTSSSLNDWQDAMQAVKTIIVKDFYSESVQLFLEKRLIEYSTKYGRGQVETNKIVDIYREVEHLLKCNSSFEELSLSWQELGDHHLVEGKEVAARSSYFSAMLCAQKSQNNEIKAICYSLLGLTSILHPNPILPQDNFNREDETLLYFNKAFELFIQSNLDNPGLKLAEVCKKRLNNLQQYWNLDAYWESCLENRSLEADIKEVLIEARTGLGDFLDTQFQLFESSVGNNSFHPIVTPVAVEIELKALPEGPDSEWELFKTFLPEMRERILANMGVKVPGVRLRGNETDLPTGNYVILLDEVPIEMGFLEPGMFYCLASQISLEALQIPTSALSEKLHPLTGQPGCWVDKMYLDILREKDFEIWENSRLYMVYHLEAVLRRNLVQFLGIQEVHNLILEWEETEEGRALVDAVLPTNRARLYFSKVLSALVKENVPITNWRKILETLKDIGLLKNEVSLIIQKVRLQLKEILPGNSANDGLIALPSEIENKIADSILQQHDKTFLAMSPEETQSVLTEIREIVDPDHFNQVLVVKNANTRPFVRQLVAIEHPNLMVISKNERIL